MKLQSFSRRIMLQLNAMYMSLSPLSVFLFLGIGQAVFLAILFLINDRGSRRANGLFAVFFLLLALAILNGTFYLTNLYQDWTFLIGLPQSFQLLIGPFFLWYVKALIDNEKRFSFRDLAHLLPFVIYLVLELSFVFQNGFYKMALMYSWLTNRRGVSEYLIRFWYEIALPLQLWVYLALVWVRIRKHEVTIRQFFSTIEDITLSWLRNAVVAFAIGLLGVTTGYLLLLLGVELRWLFLCVPIVDTLVVYYLAGVSFLRNLPDRIPATPSALAPPKYEKSSLSEEYCQRILGQLEKTMQTQKPYVDPDLTLASLSEQIKTSRNNLSQVLNQKLQVSFYDYVNRYRVEEAATRLKDPAFKDLSILDLASDCGFKSKSTFNKSFKEKYGVAPSEYRRN